MKNQMKGIAALLLGTVIWGSAFVAQSVGMDYIEPFTFQAVRCLLAVAGLLPAVAFSDRSKTDGKNFFSRWADRKLWHAGVFCGIPLFIASNLQQIGLVDVDAGKAAFLTAMYIVIVPLIGMCLGEKINKSIPFCVVLAVGGLYLLCGAAGGFELGDMALLGCAFAFAVQITCVDRLSVGMDVLRLNLIQSLVCGILSTIVMFLREAPEIGAILDCTIPLCYAGFLSMGLAYSLQIYGQQILPAAGASLIMSLESVFAALCGWMILHESMTARELWGCALVFAAVILSQLPLENWFRKRAAV